MLSIALNVNIIKREHLWITKFKKGKGGFEKNYLVLTFVEIKFLNRFLSLQKLQKESFS